MPTLRAGGRCESMRYQRCGQDELLKAQKSDSSVQTIFLVVVRVFLLPGSSLSVEAPLIGAFSRGHRFGEVSIERGANFFQPNLVCFHLLLWTDRENLHPLKNTNQPVQIPIPQKKFAVEVCFQYLRFLSPTPRSEFRPPCVLKRVRARLACM
jgi:hypothetical protein